MNFWPFEIEYKIQLNSPVIEKNQRFYSEFYKESKNIRI